MSKFPAYTVFACLLLGPETVRCKRVKQSQQSDVSVAAQDVLKMDESQQLTGEAAGKRHLHTMYESSLRPVEELTRYCFGWPENDFSCEWAENCKIPPWGASAKDVTSECLDGDGAKNCISQTYKKPHLIGVNTGDPAINFQLNDIHGQPIRLSELLTSKPVVLVYGMLTCPNFNGFPNPLGGLAGSDLENALIAQYNESVHFLHLVTIEPHPTGAGNPEWGVTWDVQDPVHKKFTKPPAFKYQDRANYARTVQDMVPGATVVIDTLSEGEPALNNPLFCSYGMGPRLAFVIGQDGVSKLTQEWANFDEIAQTLDSIL